MKPTTTGTAWQTMTPDYFESGKQFDNEEVELLRMEVDQLRFELAEKDAQVQELSSNRAQPEFDHDENEDTVRLVNRLEELLDELQTSDERTRSMEDLLRASDVATQAEREERRHLESWVEEIEQRVSQREAESAAESSRLQTKLEEMRGRFKQERARWKEALSAQGNPASEEQTRLLETFRNQIEVLERQLEGAQEENETLPQQADELRPRYRPKIFSSWSKNTFNCRFQLLESVPNWLANRSNWSDFETNSIKR